MTTLADCPLCGHPHPPIDTGLHRVRDRTAIRGFINPNGSGDGNWAELDADREEPPTQTSRASAHTTEGTPR